MAFASLAEVWGFWGAWRAARGAHRTGPATAAAPARPTDGACRASFLVPCLPPVPGGAAARVGDEPPEASAAPGPAGAKRARTSE